MTALISERRVLAGIRFVEAATVGQVHSPLVLASPRLSFTRNRSGLFAVSGLRPEMDAERDLAAHLDAFEAAPDEPVAGSLKFDATVSDPLGRYLPRRFAITLPRGEAWAQPIDVPLFPAPNALLAPNWSGVRASLRRAANGGAAPLAGARLTVIRASDDQVLGRGFSDQRGEVLVVVVGVQAVDFTATPTNGAGGGAPEVGSRIVATRIEIHTASEDSSWPPDPEAIEAEGQAWEPVGRSLPAPELMTGRVETAGLSLLLQPQT